MPYIKIQNIIQTQINLTPTDLTRKTSRRDTHLCIYLLEKDREFVLVSFYNTVLLYLYYIYRTFENYFVGQRFGVMQVKIGLALLLKDYKFVINPKTKLPVEFDRNGFLLSVKGSIWLDAIKL